jgi:hypothetical protein
MKTVSIGFYREDGDFAILATLNNNDGHLGEDMFIVIVNLLASELCSSLGRQIDVLERQDTPDYVTVENNDD